MCILNFHKDSTPDVSAASKRETLYSSTLQSSFQEKDRPRVLEMQCFGTSGYWKKEPIYMVRCSIGNSFTSSCSWNITLRGTCADILCWIAHFFYAMLEKPCWTLNASSTASLEEQVSQIQLSKSHPYHGRQNHTSHVSSPGPESYKKRKDRPFQCQVQANSHYEASNHWYTLIYVPRHNSDFDYN